MSRNVFRRLTIDAYLPRLTSGAIGVSWVMERDFNAPGPYTFTLRRHLNPADTNPVEVARGIDVFMLEDRSTGGRPQFDTATAYSMKLVDGDNKEYVSPVTTHDVNWNHQDWLLSREIIRKEVLLLKKRAGLRGWLLKRRWYGDACPACTSPVTGEATKPDCDTCYGTGIAGGYYPPMEYWVLLNPTQRLQRLTPDRGVITENDETIRGLAYPVLEPNDIWVSNTGDRYRVMENVAAVARHRGIDLVVNARVLMLPTSSVVYQVPFTPLSG